MFYGQGYMGAIEAYIAAPFFQLTGPSLPALRIGLLLLFGAFLVAIYYHTRFLYTKNFALFICLLLAAGSKDIIGRQLKAIGGYPELPLLAMLICILVAQIIWSATETSRERFSIKRIFLYFLLGLIMGLAIWADLLILPFIATGLVLLLLFSRKDLFSLPGIVLLVGLCVGIAPMIIYNVTAPFDQNIIANMAGFINASDGKSYSLLQKIAGIFFVSIPGATGYPYLCKPDAFPILGKFNAQCTFLQAGWSLGYLVLWTLAVWRAASNILRARKQPSAVALQSQSQFRQKQILDYSRLMILLSCGITVVLYATSMSAAAEPQIAARYLVCLLLSIPVVLWQLWPHTHTTRTVKSSHIPALLRSSASVGILLLITGIFLIGIVETFSDITQAQHFSAQQTKLVERLQTLGVTRLYTEYWTCNRLIFQSHEKIMCSILAEDFKPGMNRYPPYRRAVQETAKPAYLFLYRSSYDLKFIQEQQKAKQLQKYRYIKYEGYSLYVPI
ncbi:hypothetical protein KDA_42350 [Dictyobacter alpinus]|uniref:Glycosyltransferase RgtA/B/C/D-like domain-containing protein n=2 Tax=Dictyobacter alpinus TaxID=2014873 RepID=A0A402BBE2_9CHLR|nr:hypothetical protein KDA_42350 [Dictyobacter alpinus]